MANSVSFQDFYNIVGKEKRAAGAQTYNGINPRTGQELWQVPMAVQQDVDDAVVAATAAFRAWSRLQHAERRKLLIEFSDRLETYKSDLTKLLSKETGKTVEIPKFPTILPCNRGTNGCMQTEFAESEVVMGINTIRGNAEWSAEEQVLKEDENVKIVLQRVPVGVVAGITPWNYPFQMAILKIAPALMAGCTVILKPSPFTPYTALKVGEIAAQTFPAGVVQVLGGDDSLGPWITKHPGIAKISFTGSIATGKKVMAAAAETLKRVNLELGGNDAAVVTDDFDMASAAHLVAMASFAHSAQVCMATKRVYVQESVYDEFMSHLTAIVKTLKAGEGFCSPIQNKLQYDKVRSIYEDCDKQNFDFAVGSGKVPEHQPGSGFFISPAVVAKPPEKSRVVQEEAFGPILPVLTWHEDDDVIGRVNDTHTGLGATVYCRDEKRAWGIASSLETGSVWVNGGLKMHPVALFGAHKQSGIGGELGPLGLTYYTDTRTVTYWKESTTKEKNTSGSLFA